jgi:thioredoxin reductase
MKISDVVIVGTGPYGLSIAAHLGGRGVDYRIFGTPMQTWINSMPRGMRLKSEGFASSLFDPESALTLGTYCRQQVLPYADTGLPVPLETFTAYGLAFQKRFVPHLEDERVVALKKCSRGFELRISSGETLLARRVVVAAGLTHFDYVPPELSGLSESHLTHSSRHSRLDRFRGRDVVVVGAGASAIDIAALLHETGAHVEVVARKAIRFHDPPQIPRPLLERIKAPMTGIGAGWKLVFCAETPLLFHRLPEGMRLRAVRKTLGPAPGWFVRDQVKGKVPIHVGYEIRGASVKAGRVELEVAGESGPRTLQADHVIAATGYKVDLRRFAFLDADLQGSIRSVEQTPVLSSNFESSVAGLYFVGASAANSFGPLLRFAVGAGFTARRISSHLARSAAPKVVQLKEVEVEAKEVCR